MAKGAPRDWQKEAKWRRWLRAQAESGLSVRAWCRRHGQRESAFYWWRTQVARRDAEAPGFAPVRVIADAADEAAADPSAAWAGRIEIFLPGGRRVHVVGRVERRMLADVLALVTAAADSTDEGPRNGREAPAC